MNVKTLSLAVAGAALALQFGGVQADDHVLPGGKQESHFAYARNADAAHADLVRDWNYSGQQTGAPVRLRTDAELTADLVRDWSGPGKAAAAQPRPAVSIRSVEAAHNDLVRNWGS
ncbi:MAG TPA: hypothetical protein VFB20_07860 [Burkholderiales bacterium]|nr:hypothetical protein [Burkholderiales bacterium]